MARSPHGVCPCLRLEWLLSFFRSDFVAIPCPTVVVIIVLLLLGWKLPIIPGSQACVPVDSCCTLYPSGLMVLPLSAIVFRSYSKSSIGRFLNLLKNLATILHPEGMKPGSTGSSLPACFWRSSQKKKRNATHRTLKVLVH